MYKTIIIYLITIFTCTSSFAQEFDLLKNFEKGKSITFSYKHENDGYSNYYFQDTISTYTYFKGDFRVIIEDVNLLLPDSVNNYLLRINQKGISTTTKANRIISTKSIDSTYYSNIKEYLKIGYRSGRNFIKGWLFPDTARNKICPHDTSKFFYKYPRYYRFSSSPSIDTFDIKHDTLSLKNISTDCFDFAYTQKFKATKQSGLVEIVQSVFNWFDMSYTNSYTVTDISEVVNRKDQLPSKYNLFQNYPNPFNPVTTIKYSVPGSSFVSLKVYDILGRAIESIVNEEKSPGVYTVKFDGSTLVSGIYFYRLHAGNYSETKKFILMK